jgi:hypothetical protein
LEHHRRGENGNGAPEALVLQRVMIRAVDGKAIELKNRKVQSRASVELVPKEAGKVYELVARLMRCRRALSAATCLLNFGGGAALVEVPVIVNVFSLTGSSFLIPATIQ